MPTFRQGDVVRVPFPYTDRNTRQHRPALVVSEGVLGEGDGLLWVTMITSADNRRWSSDVSIEHYADAGLPAPSMVRTAKIATIDAALAQVLGAVPPAVIRDVLGRVRDALGGPRS